MHRDVAPEVVQCVPEMFAKIFHEIISLKSFQFEIGELLETYWFRCSERKAKAERLLRAC